jgi:protoporphyrin/coproporphyrin ferrochelatase
MSIHLCELNYRSFISKFLFIIYDSAHGVPQSYVALGDMYQQHIEECVLSLSDQVAATLRSDERPSCIVSGVEGASVESLKRLRTALESKKLRFHLSYQSRVGPVEWLQPYTDDKIKEFGKAGVKNLAVIPVAFVSEHIETLEEIDGEYRELAMESGIKTWKRVSALNTDKDFILDLADMVEESLQAPAVHLSEASVLRRGKDQEEIARSELNRELRYLNTSAFNDPISHVLGWRFGKVVGRIGGAVKGIVNMVF